jgi:hypothetical protein
MVLYNLVDSFTLALYRFAVVGWSTNGVEILTYEQAQPELAAYVQSYLAYPGTLPYNGYDPVAQYKAGVNPAPTEREVKAILCMHVVLEELARVWLEVANAVDPTPRQLH